MKKFIEFVGHMDINGVAVVAYEAGGKIELALENSGKVVARRVVTRDELTTLKETWAAGFVGRDAGIVKRALDWFGWSDGDTDLRDLPMEQQATATIHFDVPAKKKTAYVRAAKREEKKLVPWIIEKLDKSV